MKRLPLVVWCALGAFGYDFAALKPQGHVSDFAGVLDAVHRAELERYCARIEQSTGVEIALIVVRSLYGEPVEDVANLLFRKWGVGKKGKDTGILLLLSVQDRRSRLEVGYGLEPVIPDGYAGSLLRQMRPALRVGQYGDALAEAAHAIGARIAQSKGVNLEGARPKRAGRHREPFPWPMALGGGGMLAWLLLSAGRSRRRLRGRSIGGSGWGWVLAANMLSSMPRAHRGGGFGGYDSSDTFGGFGGGDSGGGGASGDW